MLITKYEELKINYLYKLCKIHIFTHVKCLQYISFNSDNLISSFSLNGNDINKNIIFVLLEKNQKNNVSFLWFLWNSKILFRRFTNFDKSYSYTFQQL